MIKFLRLYISFFLFTAVLFTVQDTYSQSLSFAADDSLKGFDQQAALRKYQRFVQDEGLKMSYKDFFQAEKNIFKYQKYHSVFLQSSHPNPNPHTAGITCTNADFAMNDFTGWTACNGWSPDGPAYGYPAGGPCVNPGIISNREVIMSGAGTDPCGGFPVVCPGFTYSARLGTALDALAGHVQPDAEAQQLSYSFFVSTANAIFTYYYAVVLEDPGHTHIEEPYFEVGVFDSGGKAVPCSFNHYAADTTFGLTSVASCSAPVSNTATVKYKAWTPVTIDLSAYVGQTLTATFITSDCARGGHFGYAYVAATCAPLAVVQPDTLCDGSSVNLIGPPGYASYSWLPNHEATQTISVSDSGTYSVTVTAAGGCSKQVFYHVNKYPKPTAAFNQTFVSCSLKTTAVDASTVTGTTITNWNWDFGDATTSTVENPPQHTYATDGTKNIKLVVTTVNGCKDSVTQPFAAGLPPVPAFSIANTCFNSATAFTDQTTTVATGTVTNWTWDFGEPSSGVNNTSTLQNPTHTYAATGTYTVTLTAKNSDGCSNAVTHTVTINPLPTAAFTMPAVVCKLSNTFTDASTISSGSITWSWDFGDGSTSTAQNPPLHIYASDGNKNIKLVVTSNNGCKDSVTQTFFAAAPPVSAFTAPNSCLNLTTSFTDQTTTPFGTLTNWTWDFGEPSSGVNNSSILQNPTHTYAASGSYTVTLTTKNSDGCTNAVTHTITIFPLPTASFTMPAVSCKMGNTFTDGSSVTSGTVSNWNWDFGDGTTSTTQNPPLHTYLTDGNKHIKLVVTTNNGCKDSVTQTFFAAAPPVPGFNSANSCLNILTNFTDITTTPFGTITNWTWDFGDAVSSTLQNPTHTYASAGAYTVKLITKNSDGCIDSIKHTVTIFPLPTAAFTVPPEVCKMSNTFANGSTVSSGTISTYSWSFGDGSTSALQNPPLHTYATDGTKTIKLVVTTNNGCKDSVTQTFFAATPPIPAFNTASSCLNILTNYTDLTTTPFGTITNWTWDFGDAVGSTSQNPSHTYASPGTYNVKLTAKNSDGCIDSITHAVTIYPLPTAAFTVPPAVCKLSNTFVNGSSVSSGSITTYSWDFGDGSNSALQNPPQHNYVTDGTKTIKLVVTTNNGCKDSVTNTFYASTPPVVNFSTLPVCLLNSTSFNDLSTISTGSVVGWTWDFGEPTSGVNNSSTSQDPTHLYAADGTYNVKLVALSSSGCKDSTTLPVIVYPLPVVDFIGAPLCEGFPVSFKDQSTIGTGGNLQQWSWDFGDPFSGPNNTSTATNPTHNYTAPGNYNVNETVTSDKGCPVTVQKSVTIYPKPIASFTSISACANSPLNFTDASAVAVGIITKWDWNFGDASTDDLTQNPSHTYSADGSYVVKLIVTSSSGCIDSITANATVFPLPNPDFSNTSVCLNNQTNFTDLSTVKSGSITGWTWNYGDASVNGSSANPTHTYAASGNYNVKLTVQTNNNCIASITKQDTVYPLPLPAYTSGSVCEGLVTSFTDQSTVTPGSIVKWNWSFGDSGIDSIANPKHVYASQGNYTVKLITTTDKNCIDSIRQIVTVYAVPVANFVASDSVGCEVACIDFTDQSTIASGSITAWTWEFGDTTTSSTQSPLNKCFHGAGVYSVKLTVTSNKGCSDTVNKAGFVTVHQPPTAAFTTSPDNVTVLHSTVDFKNQSSSDVIKWYWYFGDGDSISPLVQNPEHTYTGTDEATYKAMLIVVNQYGCVDTVTNDVFVGPDWSFYIPNAFSPNGDHVNDKFNGVGVNITNYNMMVFDRWGNLIFKTESLSLPWDGRANNGDEVAQQDVYVWKVQFTDYYGNDHHYLGHVTIVK